MHTEGLVDGRFRLEAEVAVGGMGRLWRARDEHTGKLVALKVIATEDPGADERFRREAQLLAKVRHPAIVEHVAHGNTPSSEPYLAMEWLEGHDLRTHLSRRGDATLPARSAPAALFHVDEVVALARRVASALAELHRQGIVHRDVKPANLFLVDGDPTRVKLLDLGAAAVVEAERRLTMTGGLVGTPAYMAPEQVRASDGITPAADVWALGCVLYECLTGAPAFRAQHMVALLAKILLDPVPTLDPRHEVPGALRALLDRCLCKEPEGRFADGEALLSALRDVETQPTASGISRALTPSLGGTERRVRCVVVGSLPASADHRRVEVERAAARAGGVLEWLSPGSFLLVVEPPGAPMDQAARAGRVALAVRHAVPEVGLALGLGQAEQNGRFPVGDAVDRAAALLVSTEQGEVRVESATVPLLEPRFDLSFSGARARLLGERPQEATRTLLGKPTVSVGRRRELGALLGAWDHAVEEPAGSVVLVTAPAGMGKSRLRYELLRTLRQRGESFTLLEGQGDALSAGSPFGLIVPAIRRWAGVRDGDPAERVQEALGRKLARRVDDDDVERLWLFFCELLGAPVMHSDDPALRAARGDPMLLGEATRRAFADWIAAEADAQPVLLVLEDLHWGDLPSVRFVEAALNRAMERPLLVVALARPEVHERFPALWEKHALQEVRLAALSRAASLQLVEQVLGSVDEGLAEEITSRAGGNAFYLEELIRAAAEGEGSRLPPTVLAMVQTRLDALGPEAKHVLRAAAVFGEVFWTAGVETMVGESVGARVDEWLEDLATREIVTSRPSARFPSQREWRFRHALVRDGAYELLTTEDRALGHRLAGEWLRGAGEQDALVLAEHFARGGDAPEAARWFSRAAEQALEGNDLEAVIARVARALALEGEVPEELVGQLHATESLARYWKSDYAGALAAGREAAARLPEGSRAWYRALGSATVASARLGEFGGVDELFERLVEAEAASDAASERLVGLARGTFQLIFAGRFDDADRVLARIAALAENEASLDALTLAQVHHVRGVRACMVGDVGTFLHHLGPAVEHFERAGDLRNASLERTTLAWCHAEVGDFEEAARIARANLERCVAMGAQQAITYAKVNLGYFLVHLVAERAEARRVLEEAVAECRSVGNLRLAGWALAHLASLERLEGCTAREEEVAREASELLVASPGLEAWALARRALACVDLGRADDALALAERAHATLDRLGGLIQGESLVPLALARASAAAGDRERAREVLERGRRKLGERAARIPRDVWREGFLRHPESLALQNETLD
ncbi:MAG: protein kinase [Sandaracinus sp.]|nr:protein kinase [Sandaracinus sp.]